MCNVHYSFTVNTILAFTLYQPLNWTSLVAQMVKRLSTIRETWVQSLGWEDSLEKEMATYSSTLAWKIPWTEKLGAGYCPWGHKSRAQLSDFTFTSLSSIELDNQYTAFNKSVLALQR